MSALSTLLGNAVSSTVSTVIVDSEFLPGPVTINTGSSGGSSSALGSLAKPSIQVLDANGNQVYASAPWGAVGSRWKAFAAIGAIGLVGFFAVYGATKFFKK